MPLLTLDSCSGWPPSASRRDGEPFDSALGREPVERQSRTVSEVKGQELCGSCLELRNARCLATDYSLAMKM